MNCSRSEAEQAPEGSKWAPLLRRLARCIVTGRIIPSHDYGGFPHAFRRHEIVKLGGVRQREADAAVGDGRAEAWMVWAMDAVAPRGEEDRMRHAGLSHSCEA